MHSQELQILAPENEFEKTFFLADDATMWIVGVSRAPDHIVNARRLDCLLGVAGYASGNLTPSRSATASGASGN